MKPTTQSFLRNSACAILLSIGLAGCGADVMHLTTDAQRQGLALYNEGQFDEAAGSFRNAIRQDPRDYRSHYYLGASYDAMKQYQLAAQAYRASLDVMPLTVAGEEDHDFRLRALDALATAISRGESHSSQISALEKNASGNASAEDVFLLAKVYRYSGDVDAALDAYNRASMLDRKNFNIVKEYGLYLEQIGQTQRAQRPLKKAYALNNQDQQVIAALRRLGIVPGPSVSDQRDLSQPRTAPLADETQIGAPDAGPAIQTPRE